jgi:hypothetical protein
MRVPNEVLIELEKIAKDQLERASKRYEQLGADTQKGRCPKSPRVFLRWQFDGIAEVIGHTDARRFMAAMLHSSASGVVLTRSLAELDTWYRERDPLAGASK